MRRCAPQQDLAANVRVGSNSALRRYSRNVRSYHERTSARHDRRSQKCQEQTCFAVLGQSLAAWLDNLESSFYRLLRLERAFATSRAQSKNKLTTGLRVRLRSLT